MQFPPDPNNSAQEHSGNGDFPIEPEWKQSLPKKLSDRNEYVSPQAFFLHEAPPPVYSPRKKRIQIPYNKKVLFIGASLFVVLVVLFIALKQFFFVPLGKTILPVPGKIMTGVSVTRDLNVVGTFEKDAGKSASIVFFYQDWGARGGDRNFPTQWVSSVRSRGSLPLVVWQPWITETYPQSKDQPVYALKNIIAGYFDNYIQQWAQDAKAWKNPLFLNFAPEMNGYWNPWSEVNNGNKAGEFVQAWRHVHAIFTTVGATNVTWVWDPNVNYSGSTPLEELYPGDAYVDWTAMDGLNWGTSRSGDTWQTFSDLFGSTYDNILQITHKPMMIAQLGSSEKGGDKAAWIIDAYSVALPERFPAIKAVVWFDQVTQTDWRIESSVAAQQAFYQAMQSSIYATNMYGGSYIG